MAADPKQTIVVTGLGVMSGVGPTLDSFWENLLAGKSSLARITHFDPRYGKKISDNTLASLESVISRHLFRHLLSPGSGLVQATSIKFSMCMKLSFCSDYTCQIGSQVPEFNPGDLFTNAKTAKSNDRLVDCSS
jgi:hypothetical protein